MILIKRVSKKLFLLPLFIAATSLVAFSSGNLFLQHTSDSELEELNRELEVSFTASPNPFEDYTVITAIVGETTDGSIIIKDRYNNIVNFFYSGTFKMGSNSFVWYGKGDKGEQLEPGRYTCELNLGTRYTSKTIILILK